MRSSEKGVITQSTGSRIFGVDFHDFVEKEQNTSTFELASEFGLTINDVKKLKNYLERS